MADPADPSDVATTLPPAAVDTTTPPPAANPPDDVSVSVDPAPASPLDFSQFGGRPIDLDRLLSDRTAIKKREAEANRQTMGTLLGRLEEDRKRQKEALDRTGIGPGDLQPWNYEQEKAKYTTGALEQFGSLGSVFAVLASAFTRTPMVNSLNGM